MLFSWLKKRRRQRILAEPVPSSWQEIMLDKFAPYASLSEKERGRLVDDMRIFIAEKEWEGCGGLELTDEMRVTVAAHACRMILELDVDYFRQVQTILIYPAGFKTPQQLPLLPGLALEGGKSDVLGQSVHRGPVLLSWKEVVDDLGNAGEGKNLIYHEFAHKLDMLNGEADGIPPIDDAGLVERWLEIMPAELKRLRRAAAAGRDTLLDSYGAENEVEFFAVASECFFQLPRDMRLKHPQLYAILSEFYRQDPAAH
jgi:hypothetical protein